MSDESEYNRIQRENEAKRKYAQECVVQDLLHQIDNFITHYKNCDVIIDTSQSDFFILPNKYKKISNVYKSEFIVDRTELSAYSSYRYTDVSTHLEKKTYGGGVSGYSVSETSSGYSVSPNYSAEKSKLEYVIDKKTERTSSEDDIVYVKAVKRGTVAEVLKKEAELCVLSNRCKHAKRYKSNQNSLNEKYNLKLATRTYNLVGYLSIVSFFAIFLLLPFSIKNSGNMLLTTLLIEKFFGCKIPYFDSTFYIISSLYVFLVIAFSVLAVIKKKFISYGGEWQKSSRGKINYLDKNKEVLNLDYLKEWQDDGLYESVKSRVIFASVFIVADLLAKFIVPLTDLCCIVMDIIIIIYSLSIVLAGIIFAPLFAGIIRVVKNQNYSRSKNYDTIIKNFITNNGFVKYTDVWKDISTYSISKRNTDNYLMKE